MKALFVLTLISCSALNLKAQSTANSEPQKIVDEFFKVYKDKGHAAAVSNLLASNKWISPESADNVSAKLTEVISQIGQYYSAEKIKEFKYGTNVVHYTYLVKYERQPLKFLFRFYRPNDKWQTQGFLYEVEFLDEIDGSPKVDSSKDSDK